MSAKCKLLLVLCGFIMFSCARAINDQFYHLAREHKSDYHEMCDYLLHNKSFEKNDSIRRTQVKSFYGAGNCIYRENTDRKVREFMAFNDLSRICLEEKDSMISFYKDSAPYVGKVKIVAYDFGKSKWRQKAGMRQGTSEVIKIIDSSLVYYRGGGIGFN